MDIAPFTFRRRVGWGECDPARIYYTPRAIDYVVEAVESLCELILKVSWSDLFHKHGLDFACRDMGCTYLRPLIASQVVRVRVWVVQIGRARLGFRVLGEDEQREVCFCSELTGCFVNGKSYNSVPIPPDFRRGIESYRNFCFESSSIYTGGDGILQAGELFQKDSGPQATAYHLSSNMAARKKIFTRDRRVMSGDCAASGILHAPRVFDFAVEAVGEWYEAIPGISWMDLVCRRNQGAPFVSAACRYLRPLRPGETLTLGVGVTHLGGASLSFAVTGLNSRGAHCFSVNLGACFIDQSGFKAMRIPQEFREPIKEYMLASGRHDTMELDLAE